MEIDMKEVFDTISFVFSYLCFINIILARFVYKERKDIICREVSLLMGIVCVVIKLYMKYLVNEERMTIDKFLLLITIVYAASGVIMSIASTLCRYDSLLKFAKDSVTVSKFNDYCYIRNKYICEQFSCTALMFLPILTTKKFISLDAYSTLYTICTFTCFIVLLLLIYTYLTASKNIWSKKNG